MDEVEERTVIDKMQLLVSLSEKQKHSLVSIKNKIGLFTVFDGDLEKKMPDTILSLLDELKRNLDDIQSSLDLIDKII